MFSLDTAVAFAIRNPTVMDGLGEALRSDLVVANPFLRRVVEFADDFLLKRRKLPADGDWEVWLLTLEEGMIREGTKEALGRLLGIDTSGYDPDFFASQVVVELQRGAAQVARARLNELGTVEPETLLAVAEKVAAVKGGGLPGVARLSDVDIWSAHVSRELDLVPTGYPTLDRLIGGWGKELVFIFADSGVGKSLWLQNAAVNVAVRGKKVLHVSLELGVRPQIHRYYRQIAQATRADFARDAEEVKDRLRHWFRLAKGAVYLLEFPAYSLDVEELKRVIARASRIMDGPPDVLVLDYLDLLTVGKKGGGKLYEDLGRLTHEVRALCGMFDLTVLTATQAVRKPERAGRLTVRDMGDSYQKVRGADVLLSLVQTEEEEEVFQGRLGVLKVRDSGGRGQELALYINRDLALIQELDHPSTRQLMEKLGHLPGQAPKAAVGMSLVQGVTTP